MSLIDSEMARPIGLKLGGMVESIRENVLVKIFFWIFESKMVGKWII